MTDALCSHLADVIARATSDGRMPHRWPGNPSDGNPECIAWKCAACAEWIDDGWAHDDPRNRCSVDWRGPFPADTAAADSVVAELAPLLSALDLVRDFVSDEDCVFDHHGYCQAHVWFETDPACPHRRAKDLLAGLPGWLLPTQNGDDT